VGVVLGVSEVESVATVGVRHPAGTRAETVNQPRQPREPAGPKKMRPVTFG